MVKNQLRVILVLLLLMSGMPASGQTEDSQDQTVDLREISKLREDSVENTTLSEEIRSRILELCDLAVAGIETASGHRIAVATFESDRKQVDRQLRNLRADLERHENRPKHQQPEFSTMAEAEDALARERARLKANRSKLRARERLNEERASSRRSISQRLGEIDLDLEMLDDELRAQTISTARSELKLAARFNTLVQKQAALSEVEMLRGKLSLLSDRSVLIPLEIDLAERRVSFREDLVVMLEQLADDLRVEQTQASLVRIRELCSTLAEDVPALSHLTAETIEFAETLLAPEGVILQTEVTIRAVSETRRYQAQLERIAELTKRKFEAYGDRGSITRWWPDIPHDFPGPGVIRSEIQHIQEDMPEVAHRLITYEQQRSAAHQLARETLLDLETQLELDPELTRRVRDLLATRQDLLDQLIQQVALYSNQLSENHTVASNFLEQVEEVERFLFSRVLWSRSVPKPAVPRFDDVISSFRWLISSEHWHEASVNNIEFNGKNLFIALLLAFIIFLRQPIRRRLSESAEYINDPEKDNLRYTAGATVMTGLLAAPLPIAILIASNIVGLLGDSTYLFASSAALSKLSLVAVFFELTRHIFAPNGLAEAHFGWPAQATRPLYRGLVLTQVVSLPLFYIAFQLGYSGLRLDSPANLQVFNNSLGRICFVAALLFAGLSILSMLRPEKKLDQSGNDVRVPWPQRFSEYSFPSVFLGAYPIVFFATLVPALLGAFGFYITGLLLAYQMLRTVLLLLVVLVGGGLLHRWRIVHQNYALFKSQENQENNELASGNEAAETQVKHLLRFVTIAVLAIGFFAIWSDALPMLQMLKRVQLLPRIEMLEPLVETSALLKTETRAAESSSTTKEEMSTSGTSVQIPGMGSADSAVENSPAPESQPLTLWNLLEAIFASIATLILVSNMPGVIEITLKHRTMLDSGARFALSALIRYSITIFGTIAVFGLLGIGWSNVQWLAAALTFGLGFGLQEIVANFVSGLILLVERPIRVGDVVTMGTLMGKVSRIQIRATTITLLDRSEMIVPNKEFITTKLINWTLSDSKRRIDIPLRVTHGTDLEIVRQTIIEIAKLHPLVLDDPAPQALLISFGDDAINFELRFVVDFGQGLATKDDVQMSISRAFREKGIEFALPRSEVKLVSGGEPVAPKM